MFLINRFPSPSLHNKSPLKLFLGLKPNYSILKTYGCLCHPHIRPYNTHKLEFCSIPCTLIGYSPHHKGYKCPSTDRKKICITKCCLLMNCHFLFSMSLRYHPSPNQNYNFQKPLYQFCLSMYLLLLR